MTEFLEMYLMFFSIGTFKAEKHLRLKINYFKTCTLCLYLKWNAGLWCCFLISTFKVLSVAQCKSLMSAECRWKTSLPLRLLLLCSALAIVSKPTTGQSSRQVGLFNFHFTLADWAGENVKHFLRSIVKHSESVANDGVIRQDSSWGEEAKFLLLEMLKEECAPSFS